MPAKRKRNKRPAPVKPARKASPRPKARKASPRPKARKTYAKKSVPRKTISKTIRRTKPNRKTTRSNGIKTVTLSAKQITARLAKQRAQSAEANRQRSIKREEKKREATAKQAAKTFAKKNLNKKDYGKLLFIGQHGQRNAASKGRKGYLVRVTKTGKVSIVKQRKNGYRAQRLANTQLPFDAKHAPDRSKLIGKLAKKNQTGKRIVRASGVIHPRGGASFSDSVVNQLSAAIHGAIKGQRSERSFIIKLMVILDVPEDENNIIAEAGESKVAPIEIYYGKADSIDVKLNGVAKWVRSAMYAQLAQYLKFYGYVSEGSFNHIRNLPVNKNKPKDEWRDSTGVPFKAIPDKAAWLDCEVVRIKALEYRIEQAKTKGK